MKRITLTFDNGSDPVMTPYVLDVLADHDVKATFFPIGHRLWLNPAALQAATRARDEGHWIGTHGFYHAYTLGDIDRADAVAFEMQPGFDSIGSLAHSRLLMRPYCYGGVLNQRVFKRIDVEKICEKGYTCVLYNSVPRDWEGGAWDERALSEMAAREWTTMVLHDIAMKPGGVSEQPISKLSDFIRKAKDEGYEFVQDYSPDAVIIAGGKVLQDIEYLIH